MSYTDDLIAKAQAAIDSGANPEAVSRRLSRILVESGYGDTEFSLKAPTPISRDTKDSYRNAVVPDVVQQLRADSQVANSPQRVFGNVESGSDTNYFPNAGRASGLLNATRSAGRTAIGGIESGLGTAINILGGVGQQMADPTGLKRAAGNYDPTADFLMKQGTALSEEGEQLPASASPSIAGSLIGGLVSFPVAHAEEAFRDVREGKDLSEAYKHLAEQTALSEAQIAAGLPFGRLAGLRGVLARAGVQGAAGAGASAIDSYLHGQSPDTDNMLVQGGVGALLGGFLGRLPDKEAPRIARSGDAAIDSGVAAVEQLAGDSKSVSNGFTDNIKWNQFPEQGDMFTRSGNSVLQGDLFGAEPVEGQTAELRRQLAMETPTERAESAQTDLERNYLLDRQQRLDADRAAREQAQIDADAQHIKAVQEQQGFDFTDVGVPPKAAEEPAVLRVDNEGNPVGYSEQAPNDAMRQAFEAANTRRTLGLNEGPGTGPAEYYPEIAHNNEPAQVPSPNTPRQPEVFEPSRNPIVEQQAEQAELPIDSQGDLFPNKPASQPTSYYKPFSQEERSAAPSVAEPKSFEQTMKDAQASREAFAKAIGGEEATAPRSDLPTYTEPGNLPFLAKSHGIPASLIDHLSNGTLTGKKVYDAITNNLHDLDNKAPIVGELVKTMRGLAKRFGGEDVSIEVYNPRNPEHQKLLNTPERMAGAKAARAQYFPSEHKVLLYQDANIGTILHEMDHAVRERVLDLADKGRLDPKTQQAYKALETAFEDLRPKLLAKAEAMIEQAKADGKNPEFIGALRKNLTYGLGGKNMTTAQALHELSAEMLGNGVFRNFLRNTTIESLNLPAGQRLKLANFKNVLSAIAGKFNRMLGISPKLDNAFDTFYTAHQNVLDNVTDEHAGVIRERKLGIEAKTSTPDLSFLGERATPRASALPEVEQADKQQPRSRLATLRRAAFNAGGIEPVVAAARDTQMGLKREGSLEAIQAAHRLKAVTTPENSKDILAAQKGDIEALSRLSPEAKKVVGQEYLSNYDRVLANVKRIQQDPAFNSDTAQGKTLRAMATKMLENGGAYQYSSAASDFDSKYLGNKLKLADKAEQKIASGKESSITAEEAEAKYAVTNLSKYMQDQYLPTLDKLKSMSSENLEKLYKFHTASNPDETFNGFDKEDRRAAMQGAIAAKLREITNPEHAVEHMLQAAAGLSKDSDSRSMYVNNMRRNSYIYSQLEDVPKEFRDFWGEVSEPAARQLATVRAQYEYAATLESQNQLREEGLAKGLFSTDRNGVHQTPISGEGMGPLKGLFTTPDVKQAMDSVYAINNSVGSILDHLVADPTGVAATANLAAKAVRVIRKGAGITKLASVLGNVGNLPNNFLGSPAQLVSNGNINPMYALKGMKTLAEASFAERRSSISPEARDLYRYGILEYSHIHELEGNKLNAMASKILKEAIQQKDPQSFMMQQLNNLKAAGKAVGGTGKAALEAYKELYSAMDLYTKVANWHYELDFWKAHNEKYGTGLSEDQIKQQVARRINDTNITPSKAPVAVKMLENVGLTRFAAYYTELARTAKNNMIVGGQDFVSGVKNGQTDLAMHGLRRLLGTSVGIAATGKLQAGLAKAVMTAMGLATTQLDDSDPRKKYMDKDKFWESQQPMLVSNEDGTYGYDLSRPNPYAPLWNPIQTAVEAISKIGTDNKGAEDKAKQAVASLSDLWASNTLWKGLKNAAMVVGDDSDARAPMLAKTSPTKYSEMKQWLTENGLASKSADALLSAAMPIIPRTALNVAEARELSTPAMQWLVGSGIGISKFDPKGDLGSYVGHKDVSDINKAKSLYTDLMKQDYQSSPERLDTAFRSAIKKAAEPYENLKLAVAAAQKEGASRKDIVQQLQASNVSEDMIAAILRNKPLPITALQADLSKDAESDILAAGKDIVKRREAIARFKSNSRLLNNLLRKYRNVDIDSL